MYDLFDVVFGTYVSSKVAGISALQASTDQRLTSSTERLTALEHKYERMHIVMVALWGLLKEHTSLTDADLKRFVANVEASEAQNRGAAGTMACPHCSRTVRKSATRCPWCGGAITTGDAFQGT
ncbi:MAG: hypothetical protein JSS29_20010 [Proteobacteria bacterium]|nr:hypothetical protein [Pseudomonadota bacterium]